MELRDYQTRIVAKTVTHFKEKCPSVCITSPTGSGKSVIAMHIAKQIEDEFGLSINWVAMRRNLLRQAAETNTNHFGVKNINFVSMFDANPPKADMIILDECQHAATESFNHIASYDVKFMLGLSATPIRTDKLKLPFQRTVQDAGIHRLIQEGWLSKYHHWCMEEFNAETVANAYLKDKERWGKTVVFFHQLTECDKFQNILADAGVRCEVVRGDSTNAKREEQLDAFEAGEYPVIANVAILTEGFDCPDLKTVFCRDSARLPTIQMAGRGFRIHEGKTHCNIVQSKMSHWQFIRTAKPEKSWVQKNSEWFALGSNEHVEGVVKGMVNKLVEIEVEMPKFILKNRAKKRMFDKGFTPV